MWRKTAASTAASSTWPKASWPGASASSRPPGGFFLWLDVGDGVEAARRLWAEAGVKVLPGRYLAADAEDGGNEAHAYIRVALVDDVETTGAALERIAATL